MEEERVEGNRIDLNLLDPHMHGVALINGALVVVDATDFTDLDALVRAHPKWPG